MAQPPFWGPKQKGPRVGGTLSVDFLRGSPRVKTAKPPAKTRPTLRQLEARFLFSWWLKSFKYLPGDLIVEWQNATKGTPFMPSDLYVSMMSGRLFALANKDGTMTVSKYVRPDVSQSLDVLGAPIGAMLYRGEQLWGPVAPANAGDVLHSGGIGGTPFFAPSSGSYGWTLIGAANPAGGLISVTGMTLTAFSVLKILIAGVVCDSNQKQIYLQFGQGGFWISANYQTQREMFAINNAIASGFSSGTSFIPFMTSGAVWGSNTSATGFLGAELFISNPGVNGVHKPATFIAHWKRANGEWSTSRGIGISTNTAPITACRVGASTGGNITAGTVTVFGA